MTNPITTINRERLEQLADENTICKVSWDERIEMSRILLAVMDAPPVSFYAGGAYYNTERAALKDGAEDVTPLYAAPPAPSAPDGWIKCSDRMPASRHEVLVGCHWGNGFAKKWATYIPGHPDAQSSGWLLPGASWTPTHWHELPAAPEGD